MFDLDFLSLQDEYLVNILEEVEVLGHDITEFKSSNRIKGHFYSDDIFNLSHRVLFHAVIKKLSKGLGFAPISMRTKWNFWNELT